MYDEAVLSISNTFFGETMTFAQKILEAAEEGIVLLKNERGTLPLGANERVSVFGRGQFDFLKCGLGSGGSVHAPYSTNLIENLPNANPELSKIYAQWIKENPFDNGSGGWAAEPFCQKEMPITKELALEAAKVSQKAVVVITRNAGEDKDLLSQKGSYFLTDEEIQNIKNICIAFEKVAIIFNTCGIIDMAWMQDDEFFRHITAIVYAWQGGQEAGRATANILLGKTNPSGKLSDTIARSIDDYPSTKNFADTLETFYCEDIFVGYRFFNTFAHERILYPFGFGLSYTQFDVEFSKANFDGKTISISARVKNIGSVSGKEVVQIYAEAPQGKLGKPARVLAAFKKTSLLQAGQEETISLSFEIGSLASYDDSGASGNRFCRVLEAGEYFFYGGTDVSSAQKISFAASDSLFIENQIVVEKSQSALAPIDLFKRIKVGEKLDNGNYKIEWEDVPRREYDIAKRIEEKMPREILFTGNAGIKFADILSGKNSLDEFVAQLTDEELATFVRGEGMCSRKVTMGVASAFGGVSKALYEYGVPVASCADGPSGVRMDTGKEASLMPIGTLLACTWNPNLVEELMRFEGEEIRANEVDTILGPGINIHRNPLGGRNFEYYSEDPLLTGMMTLATVRGIASSGAHATIKHFAANSRETSRRKNNSIMSERAAREIYLKAFEMAVKEGGVRSIMSSYNLINGIQAASNFDLNTTILRGEWNYKGLVMTDWWATMNDCANGGEANYKNMAQMVCARNDVYMVVENDAAEKDGNNDNIKAALKQGSLTRAQLQVCAKDVLNFLKNSLVAKRPLRSLDDILSFEPSISEAEDGKPVAEENCKFMKNGETKSLIKVAEEGVYNFLALYSKPSDGTVSQSVCNLKINGRDALSLDCRTTEGKTVGALIGLVKLAAGIYEVTLEHTKPGIKIEFLGFSRRISSATGIMFMKD